MKNINILRVIFLISIISFFTNCSSVNKIQNKESRKKSSVENFDVFYDKFHSDSVFQMSRISFPLKGEKVDWNGQQQWTIKNWVTLKTKIYDVSTSEFKTDYKKTDSTFVQKFWLKDSGYFSEYRFELINKKWRLVYAHENNL